MGAGFNGSRAKGGACLSGAACGMRHATGNLQATPDSNAACIGCGQEHLRTSGRGGQRARVVLCG
jgi:hypothetical protein